MEPIYSRDECIEAFCGFYNFLGKMFMDVPSSIIYPPADGWPDMTPEVMECLGKDSEIINLLRHLPFPDNQPYTARPQCLPGCRLYEWKVAVDGLKEGLADREDLLLMTEGEEGQFGGRIPKHCVGITSALNISEYVMLLDIKTGLVYWMDCPKEILEACDPQPSLLVYPLKGEAAAEQDRSSAVVTAAQEWEEDDAEASDSNADTGEHETPPTTDDENDDADNEYDESEDEDESENVEWGPCWPVRHFFTMLKNHFIKLNFIPHSSGRIVQIWTERYIDHNQIPEGASEFLQIIYRKHGWPDLETYHKEACLAELKRELETKGSKYYNLDQYYCNREY